MPFRREPTDLEFNNYLLHCRRRLATVLQICGIMNGTTNFMLSKMESDGADYGDVLKEAQDLGYAEGEEACVNSRLR